MPRIRFFTCFAFSFIVGFGFLVIGETLLAGLDGLFVGLMLFAALRFALLIVPLGAAPLTFAVTVARLVPLAVRSRPPLAVAPVLENLPLLSRA
jgi:UDP-N-acetylmuramyl pentapeptide phosphotransferase/UDP-N-acetylglucosamine-1-phosphate transferase